MFAEIIGQTGALAAVLIIDIVLAGDNAIVVGLAAGGLAPEQRRIAIVVGVAAATVLRIVFALVTMDLLEIIGLTLAGGLLLLWVAWKMYRELRRKRAPAVAGEPAPEAVPRKTLTQAVTQIVVADLSMSLDNVIAVAGVAQTQAAPWVLVVGLVFSVALMGAAATAIARLLDRYAWIAWVGLAIITVVALRMIWEGSEQILAQ
jgi:YjbE family integral membrane protein